MQKLLAIHASPRRGGNTDIILGKILESAKKESISVRRIDINKLKIRPCQGCLKCRNSGICDIKDDVAFVFNEILAANIIVIGSPLYFGNVPAQLKALIDRAQQFYVRKYILKEIRAGGTKKGLFFLTGAREDEKYLLCTSLVVGLFFKVMDIDFAGKLYMSGNNKKRDVLKNKAGLAKVEAVFRRTLKT